MEPSFGREPARRQMNVPCREKFLNPEKSR
jgi:hypothetical protein